MKFCSGGITGFNSFLFLTSLTTVPDLEESDVSMGSPGKYCQWSNTHCGKAFPPVWLLRSSVNPANKQHIFKINDNQIKIRCLLDLSWMLNLKTEIFFFIYDLSFSWLFFGRLWYFYLLLSCSVLAFFHYIPISTKVIW